MEAEILKTLHEIRSILFVLVSFIVFGAFIWSVRAMSLIVNNFREAYRNKWDNEADDFFNKGQYQELENHCKKKLEDFPNSPWALLWLAKAKRALNESQESIELFEKVLQLEPSWKENFIEPYFKDGELKK